MVLPYVPFLYGPPNPGSSTANGQSGVTLKYAEASDLPDLAEFESFIPVCSPIAGSVSGIWSDE